MLCVCVWEREKRKQMNIEKQLHSLTVSGVPVFLSSPIAHSEHERQKLTLKRVYPQWTLYDECEVRYETAWATGASYSSVKLFNFPSLSTLWKGNSVHRIVFHVWSNNQWPVSGWQECSGEGELIQNGVSHESHNLIKLEWCNVLHDDLCLFSWLFTLSW